MDLPRRGLETDSPMRYLLDLSKFPEEFIGQIINFSNFAFGRYGGNDSVFMSPSYKFYHKSPNYQRLNFKKHKSPFEFTLCLRRRTMMSSENCLLMPLQERIVIFKSGLSNFQVGWTTSFLTTSEVDFLEIMLI